MSTQNNKHSLSPTDQSSAQSHQLMRPPTHTPTPTHSKYTSCLVKAVKRIIKRVEEAGGVNKEQ